MRNAWIRFAQWLLRKCGQEVIVCDSSLVREARKLSVWADAAFGEASGEMKRHQVYARLIKTFPERKKRDLAKAIEACL